jgi:CheY-like chemotaxis protein
LLKGEECSDDMREVVEDIELSARRGSDLVKQVLSFARGKEGLRVSVRLGDIVKEVISIIEKTFSKKISLKIDVAPDLWTVSGDPTQLNQILLNLCVNAGDAMPDGGYLTISARNLDVDEQYAATSPQIEKGKYVLLNVADTGCGIPADKLDRIFDPFFTTKDLGKGTGLGLATVLGVVRSHGGFMNVTSEVDKGTNFIVHLPAQVDTEEAGLIEQSDEDLPRGNGECILLVDDEAPILKVTSKTLQAYGYRVLTASNGAKAVAVFAQNQEDIALVLTDMMMPVMDGPAAIHALLRIRPELKIIGASGLTSKGVMARANLPGVKHFIAKPYSAAGLLKLVRSCLSDGAP